MLPVRRDERRLSGRAAFLTEKRAGRDDPPGESYIELSICVPRGTRTFFTASLVRGHKKVSTTKAWRHSVQTIVIKLCLRTSVVNSDVRASALRPLPEGHHHRQTRRKTAALRARGRGARGPGGGVVVGHSHDAQTHRAPRAPCRAGGAGGGGGLAFHEVPRPPGPHPRRPPEPLAQIPLVLKHARPHG